MLRVAMPWVIVSAVVTMVGYSIPHVRPIGTILWFVSIFVGLRELSRAHRELVCPQCNHTLGDKRPGRLTIRQLFVGGWTCPNCGCDVDRYGSKHG
jgi:hypothetical protein